VCLYHDKKKGGDTELSFELNYAMVYFRDQGLYAEIKDGKLLVRNGDAYIVLREVVDELYYVEDSYPDKSYVGRVMDLDQLVSLLKSGNLGAI